MKTLPRRIVEWFSRRLAFKAGAEANRDGPGRGGDATTPDQYLGSRAGEETVGVASQRTPVQDADQDASGQSADATSPHDVPRAATVDSAAAEPLSGLAECIDHFEIRRVLGHGGSGSVFLAHDTKLDRMVALKLLDKLDKQSARDMLDDETRAASKLKHPNLVTVFQSGEHARGCYIIFEYIPGPGQHSARTLRELLRERHRIPPREAVSIMRQIAAALSYAHAAGVVHRDIKPENVLVDYKGSAFLADFGCARRQRRKASGVRSFVGTIPYMSVEQIEGRWNAKTDIWSAGVVLYEMLSGERPFAFAEKTKSRSAAEATFSFAAAIVSLEHPAPIPEVDADLAAICRKCLRKNPDDRYESAAALEEDLARWQRNEPVSCRRAGTVERVWRWAQRNPLVAAQLAAIAIILIASTCISSYFSFRVWQARQAYVDEQIARLDQVDAATFDTVVQNLQHPQFRTQAEKSILSRWQELALAAESGKPADRLAAAIVTFQRAGDGTTPDSRLAAVATEHVRRALLSATDPDEFTLLRRYAIADRQQGASDAQDWITSLWQAAKNAEESAVQFRALAALASYDPHNNSWNTWTEKLAQELLEQDEQEVAAWAATLAGVADQLAALLEDFDSENEARRTAAAIAYATFTRAPEEIAKRVAGEESPAVVRELLLQLKSRLNRSDAVNLLDELEASLLNATARQRANLTAARLFLAGPDEGGRLPIFAHPADRLPRYLFERDAQAYGLTPYLLLAWADQLHSQSADSQALQTALLALGWSNLARLPDRNRVALVNEIAFMYQDNRADVHAAAAWVLRRWNEEPPEVDKHRRDDQENSWRINRLGQLMVRIKMADGSPAEVGAYEVTVREYAQYVRARAAHYGPDEPVLSSIRKPFRDHFNENTQVERHDEEATVTNPEDNIPLPQQRLPMRHVTALQAIAYCVWASREEGMSESQLGFRLREDLQTEGSTLLETVERNLVNFASPLIDCPRDAPGYRLPFSDEWEHLFAEDLMLNFDNPAVLDELGWYVANSQQRIWPVGGKRPNRLGVFDTAGNVTEWCLARIQATHIEIDNRGSSYESSLGTLRPLTPEGAIMGGHRAIGFRLVRMLE